MCPTADVKGQEEKEILEQAEKGVPTEEEADLEEEEVVELTDLPTEEEEVQAFEGVDKVKDIKKGDEKKYGI